MEYQDFSDANGDEALEAAESGTLYLKVRNDGLGLGKLQINLTPTGPDGPLAFSPTVELGALQPAQEKEVEIEISASTDLDDGTQDILVEIVEEQSDQTLSFSLRLATRQSAAKEAE